MATEQTKQKKGGSPAPSESAHPNDPQKPKEKEIPKEGDYRNVETGANKPEEFGNDYEIEQEDELTMEEAESEDEGETGKS